MQIRSESDRSQQSRRYMNLLSGWVVEQDPDAIYIVDAQTRHLVDANAAFEKLLGYSVEDIPTLTIYTLVNDTPGLINARFQRVLHSGSPIRSDREYRHKNGSIIRVDASAFRLEGPSPQFVVTVARDVTAQRRAERQVRWYRDQLRRLTSQLYLTEQRERRRTAQILHDQAGQLLTAAILRLDAVRAAAPAAAETLASELEQINRLIRSASNELRSITLQLNPPVLSEQGLCKAVEWLAQSFRAQHGMTIRVQTQPTDLAFGDELSIVLFQSLRELLLNVLKHANASLVEIELTTRPGFVDLAVSDDGVGFDPALQFNPDSERIGGFGLFSIGERLTHLGGGMDIQSHSGSGTRVMLHIPLSKG